ncbi:unnamed protein product [Anisakis simplex]|uniref:Uncharacterized protein n=1 Tax=Anisakis simplex TaxID=6269 RepID=A0A0M3JWG3_ANISI|nr:unnamed protein product [Anisakis simplex]
MGGGVSPSKNATMMMMGVDREQIGSNRVAVQNRSDNHEDEDEEVHERLYNPFHSFDLTTTAHQFSALNL